MPRGYHRFRFEFKLPEYALPCSFESKMGTIRYYLRVIFDILYASTPQGLKYFTVIGPHLDCMDDKYLVSRSGRHTRNTARIIALAVAAFNYLSPRSFFIASQLAAASAGAAFVSRQTLFINANGVKSGTNCCQCRRSFQRHFWLAGSSQKAVHSKAVAPIATKPPPVSDPTGLSRLVWRSGD